jgi:hypothetical protein
LNEPSELQIQPFFNDDLKNIHPAMGTVNGTAYIGVWVPCQVTDEKGHIAAKDYLYLVTSERQTVLGLNQELIKRQWRLDFKPIHYKENRWSLADVQAYLNGADVDPGEVYEQILNLYKEYLELPSERLYVLHALWSIGTYFQVLFNSYPYLYIGGVKRSGKTKTLTVHSILDFNAIFSNNMSSATLYRLIQNSHATLLIDESEKLSNPQRAQEFRNILLAGYKKGPSTFRCGKDAKERIEPEGYAVFGPKCIANISGLEDILEDRCITQFQQRTRNKTVANKEIDLLDSRYAKLRGQLCILFLQHWKEVSAIYAELSDVSELGELGALSDGAKADPSLKGSEYVAGRELELWKPLYALAEFFDHYLENASSQDSLSAQGALSLQMKELSCVLAKQRHTENLTDVGEENLIQVLLGIVPKGQDVYWVKLKEAKKLLESRSEEHQEWLTTAWIGRALRRLGFAGKRRLGTGAEYNVPSAALEDLRLRMQVEPETPLKPEEPEVKSCFLCRMALPKDHSGTTTYDSKEVHVACYRHLTDGLKTPEQPSEHDYTCRERAYAPEDLEDAVAYQQEMREAFPPVEARLNGQRQNMGGTL